CAAYFYSFFFQAEDGIRDRNVTGVQTCALPILGASRCAHLVGRIVEDDQRRGADESDRQCGGSLCGNVQLATGRLQVISQLEDEIGRASCREGGESWVGARRIGIERAVDEQGVE